MTVPTASFSFTDHRPSAAASNSVKPLGEAAARTTAVADAVPFAFVRIPDQNLVVAAGVAADADVLEDVTPQCTPEPAGAGVEVKAGSLMRRFSLRHGNYRTGTGDNKYGPEHCRGSFCDGFVRVSVYATSDLHLLEPMKG
jgi:hypothetical protein